MKSMKQKPTKTPYYKLDKEYESVAVPTFRRTLANHVRDNMLCCGRRSYYQRIIYVAKHKKIIEPHKIKEPFNKVIKEVYKYPTDDRLGGLMIGHDWYSLHMLEGSDDLIGKYCQILTKTADELFEKNRIVLVYNNINLRFLEKIVWRLMEIPEEPQDVEDNLEKNISLFMKKMYFLCTKIKEEESDEGTAFKSIYISSDFEDEIPDEKLMDYILDIKHLQTIQEFANIYGDYSSMLNYVDHLWPITHDNVPNNVFDWNEYDINLHFPEEQIEEDEEV